MQLPATRRPSGPAQQSAGAFDSSLSPGWPSRACALFLDFDGTLVDLAETPDAVRPAARLPELLSALAGHLGGALAIASGRPIAEIDHHLAPLKLCAAGVHGTERRAADGVVRRLPVAGLDEAAALISSLCMRHAALRMERKPGAIALHYRQAPELEALCLATIEEAVQRTRGMCLMRGKAVVEIKPARATKGAAVRAFMEGAPFRSRRPWFIGDDVTDESAFELVQSIGGVAVKVGEGETLAAHRLPDPAAVLQWLDGAVRQLGSDGPEGA